MRLCSCVHSSSPPIDEYAHQHQQADDGEGGDHSQGHDSPLLPLHASHQPNAGLMATVSALWWKSKEESKHCDQSVAQARKKIRIKKKSVRKEIFILVLNRF